jgi:hypothetical protein
MVFLDENTIRIAYSDNNTFELGSVIISLDCGEFTPILSDDELNTLLLGFEEYIEGSIYNADHSQVALTGIEAVIVIDLASQELILSLPIEPDSYNAFPVFSPDGTKLYVAQEDDIDNPDVRDATLFVYSLPDGELLASYPIPSSFFFVSPDEQYVVVNRYNFSNTVSDLVVVDLASGAISQPFNLFEESRPVVMCLNDGRDMTDLDFRTDGRLRLAGVSWLPDSSGFFVTRSYEGPTLSGSPCAFDYSRLNRFEVVTN